MKIEKNTTYFLITPEPESNRTADENYQEFVESLKEKLITFKKNNLILDFSNLINIDLNKILLLSHISETHKKTNSSFVLVCKGIELNDLPEQLMVVPTLQEAKDIVEIEDIERDLGI